MRVSKSRNVCGYVKAMRRYTRLRSRLQDRESALLPLRRKVEAMHAEVLLRRGRLTGSQLAEADRILEVRQ